jgi:hypothetical protein
VSLYVSIPTCCLLAHLQRVNCNIHTPQHSANFVAVLCCMAAGLFPCEHSSRQMWKWRVSPRDSQHGYLQLLVSVVTDEEGDVGFKRQLRTDASNKGGDATFRCMGRGDDNRKFLRLWDCFPPGERLDGVFRFTFLLFFQLVCDMDCFLIGLFLSSYGYG